MRVDKCLDCNVTFADQEKMADHKAEHHYLGYLCKICQSAFGEKEDAIEHIKTYHQVERTPLQRARGELHRAGTPPQPKPKKGKAPANAGSDRSKKRRFHEIEVGGEGVQEGTTRSKKQFLRRPSVSGPDSTTEESNQTEPEDEEGSSHEEEEEDDQPMRRRRWTTPRPGLEDALQLKENIKVMLPQQPNNGPQLKYQCPHCPNRGFPFEALLRQHMAVHHMAKGIRENVCHICKKQFVGNSKSVTRHIMSVHMPSTVAPLRLLTSCQYCSMQPASVMEHYIARHLNKIKYIPEPKSHGQTSSRPSTARSSVAAAAFVDGPLKCGQCPQSFFFEELLQVHTNTQHSRDKKFICHICSAINTQMTSHVTSMHMKDSVLTPLLESLSGSVVCPVCDRSFVNAIGTAKHMLLKHEWAAHARVRPGQGRGAEEIADDTQGTGVEEMADVTNDTDSASEVSSDEVNDYALLNYVVHDKDSASEVSTDYEVVNVVYNEGDPEPLPVVEAVIPEEGNETVVAEVKD